MVCASLILEKIFLGKWLSKLPGFVGHVYCLAAVLVSWVLFELESSAAIGSYLSSMFGLNGGLLWDNRSLYLGRENLILLAVGILAATPVFAAPVKHIRESRTGLCMALYSLGEKVIPAVLLIMSIAYVVEASFNPFLYFRF